MKSAKTDSDLKTYRKIACRYCQSPLAAPFLELGTMALANSFLSLNEKGEEEFTCPLNLVWCEQCKLVQLTHVVPPQKMFSNYLYVSSTTKTFQEHFLSYAKTVQAKLSPKNNLLAVDIGSNDGLLLSCYQKAGMRAVGIEPAKNLSDEANKSGLTTLNRFFDRSCAQEILSRYGKADIVSANNVFAHIDDVREVCRNVYELLDEHGLFVIEFPYLITMFEEMFFDMIYHEHLSYISITALNRLMNDQKFKIVDIERVASHGGSLRVFCSKNASRHFISPIVKSMLQEETEKGYLSRTVYENFASQVNEVHSVLNHFVRDIKSKKQTISGYGAPAKGSTIINYCGFTHSDIDYVVDDNPLKQNTCSPGAHIPIVSSAYLYEHPTDYVIIFAWNFASEILEKVKRLREQGIKFIIPLPKPKIVSSQ